MKIVKQQQKAKKKVAKKKVNFEIVVRTEMDFVTNYYAGNESQISQPTL